MEAFLRNLGVVSGCLWGLFLGLAPFALVAMLVLSRLDPSRKEPKA